MRNCETCHGFAWREGRRPERGGSRRPGQRFGRVWRRLGSYARRSAGGRGGGAQVHGRQGARPRSRCEERRHVGGG
eukprot:365399-Chlamydomonas_euryale.AAC.7